MFLSKRLLCLGAIGVSLLSTTGVSSSSAAPLHASIRDVELKPHQLPFSPAGWKVKSESNVKLINRINSLSASVPDWMFTPTSCTPPVDPITLTQLERVVYSAYIESFTNKAKDRTFFIAVAPDSSLIQRRLADVLSAVDQCADVSVENRTLDIRHKVTAEGHIRTIDTPSIPHADQVYAFKISGSADVPDSNAKVTQVIAPDIPRGHKEGSGVIYLAKLRNVWVGAFEGGSTGKAPEALPAFLKQVELVEKAR